MLNDLEALFDVGGFKDDLMAYGTMGAGAIGANLAWGFIASKLPASVPSIAKHLGAVALAVVGGNYIARYNRNLGQGVAVGLMVAGATGLVKELAPDLAAKAGLAGSSQMLLAGLGEPDLFQQYLNGATTTIEENVSGAPVSVESINGLAAVLS